MPLSPLTVFTIHFIRSVRTVPQTVTLSAAMDTVAVLTLELVRPAGTHSWGEKTATLVHLVVTNYPFNPSSAYTP